jgi:serine/threonine protein kinase
MNIYIVLEYLEGSNLLKYVAKKENLKEPLCKRVMKQILEGLNYLHEIGIVHRDIKLDNIMMTVKNDQDFLSDQAVPKIIDFGLATVVMPDESRTEGFGTIAYCSPEIIMRKPYSIKTDIWSMGVVFYVLISGYFPFIASDKRQVIRNILQMKITLKSP